MDDKDAIEILQICDDKLTQGENNRLDEYISSLLLDQELIMIKIEEKINQNMKCGRGYSITKWEIENIISKVNTKC